MYIWRYFSSLIHLYKAIYLISYIKNNVLPIDSFSLWTQTFILLMNTIVTKAKILKNQSVDISTLEYTELSDHMLVPIQYISWLTRHFVIYERISILLLFTKLLIVNINSILNDSRLHDTNN